MYNNKINEIKITENRFTHTNKDLNYTCIEIFDNEPYNNYLTIDNNINNNNAYEEYKLDKFFIIQFIDSPSFDCGYIQMIDNNKQMYYAISTLPGSSGSPILNSYRNLSVIGIHCGKVNKGEFKDKCNRGTYFQPILNDINMFYNCSSLTSLNLSNFNTNNVTNMSSMFRYCSKLTSLNLSNFNTNNVTNMRNLFKSLNKRCKIITNDIKLLNLK